MMQMTDTELTLLALIAGEHDRVAKLSPYRDMHDDPREWSVRWTSKRDLPLIGCRVNGSWIGSSEAARKARYRALLRLRELGLIELHSDGGRGSSHAKLTALGKQVAGMGDT